VFVTTDAFTLPEAAAPPADALALDVEEWSALMARIGEKPFRARQVFDQLHARAVGRYADMTDLSLALREKLAAQAPLHAPTVDQLKVSSDGTRKYRLLTHDGDAIEAVWIPHASGSGRHALCISSQVGCAMGCTFCATAALKLKRHLTAGEIVGQLYAVLRDLNENLPDDPPDVLRPDDDLAVDDGDDDSVKRPRRVSNIVFMGMGEPLHNLDEVLKAIRLFTHERGQGMSPRRLTVSTSGIVPAIARLGAESDVHLAISLNATTDDVRRAIMPVDKRWPIAELLRACAEFPVKRRRRLTFEYVMLKGVNDSDADARRLVELVRPLNAKVNLIPWNPHPLSSFERPEDTRVGAFRSILDRAFVSCFVRTTRGLDIDAACGMLGAKKLEEARGLTVLQ
jgi:23S rRNA (adenine2503-C2)-methyltransferase